MKKLIGILILINIIPLLFGIVNYLTEDDFKTLFLAAWIGQIVVAFICLIVAFAIKLIKNDKNIPPYTNS